MLSCETCDLVFEENEACGIFKHLCIWIDLEPGFGNPCSSILRLSRLHTGLEEQFASTLRLSAIEAFPPSEITSSVRRIRIARNAPALEMLAPCRQAKQLRRAWRKTNQPRLHPVSVDEFSGPPVQALGIARMSGVDELTRNCIGIHLGTLPLKHAADETAVDAERRAIDRRGKCDCVL